MMRRIQKGNDQSLLSSSSSSLMAPSSSSWSNNASRILWVVLLLTVCLCQSATGVADTATSTSSSASPSTTSSSKHQASTTTTTRSFTPILNENGEKSPLQYYRRRDATTSSSSNNNNQNNNNDQQHNWAVRYYDSQGLVDVSVPDHFPHLSDDRVVYELRWKYAPHSVGGGGGGNWTERTALEILYHSWMEPPVMDESLFENPHYHPKAALKQQQRQSFTTTTTTTAFSSNGGNTATGSTTTTSSSSTTSNSPLRRTYQQHLQENAVAAAAAYRAGGLTGHTHSNILAGAVAGLPVITRKMDTAYGWLRDDVDICEWEGVRCGDFSATSQYYWNTAGIMTTLTTTDKIKSDSPHYSIQQEETWTCDHCPNVSSSASSTTTTTGSSSDTDTEENDDQDTIHSSDHYNIANRVTKLELPYAGLVGTLPTEIAMLRYLHRLDLRGNRIYGTLPTTLHQMEYLQYFDLTRNDLSGTLTGVMGNNNSTTSAATDKYGKDEDALSILATTEDEQEPPPPPPPPPPSFPPYIREVWLGSNQLRGTIPLQWNTPLLIHLDLSKNQLTGSLPRYGRKQLPKLRSLLLEDNRLTGKLPPKWVGMTDLEVIDVGGNHLNGTIATLFGTLSNLREFNIVGNTVTGTIPTELFKLSNLEALMLSENQLVGVIPGGDDTVPHRAMREPEAGYKWSQLAALQFFHVNDNFLTSTLPPDLFYGLANTIQRYVCPAICSCRAHVTVCFVIHCVGFGRLTTTFSHFALPNVVLILASMI